MTRVLAIWLDGFEVSLADDWELPHLARFAAGAARATLDNGTAHLTGLSGEHLSSGLDPGAAGRASAIRFDPATYTCVQEGSLTAPAFGGVPSVVFDPCYFDLEQCGPEVRGLTDWGAHDPGGPGRARPAALRDEVVHRFGAYPAAPWLYAVPWDSQERCARMGADLTAAVRVRTAIAEWLLAERLVDWELALIGVSEAHSGSEGLFHGVDEHHPLAGEPSVSAAGAGLRSVYTAIDDLVGTLVERFPDAVHVVFSMHGMGPNRSDVPSMALLGELMARWAGTPTRDVDLPVGPAGVPRLDDGWSDTVFAALAGTAGPGTPQAVRSVARRLPLPVKGMLKRMTGRPSSGSALDWMPVMRHQARWAEMRAFALPSYYDGRVRVNLVGREAEGMVEPREYERVLDDVEGVLRACREPRTGEPVVQSVHRPSADPMALDPTDADLVIEWADDVLGLEHPTLGRIGPLPPRRTGGHTSPIGRCLVRGPGVEAGDLGTHSSFDVLPTLLALAGVTPGHSISGHPLPVIGSGQPG